MNSSQSALIGDYPLKPQQFKDTDKLVNKFNQKDFQQLSSIERNRIVNKSLLELIQNSPENCFLLREVVHYMQCITDAQVLDGHFNLTAFERWLNQHSLLSQTENRRVRAKIVGKYLPRSEFQAYFPIGHDKYHPFSHVVTAHNPPDLDSTTASFVGWMDAFACRVSTSLTIWNVPGGEPGPLISQLFNNIFTREIFERVAKHKPVISPVAMDLVDQSRLIRVSGESNIRDFQHERNTNHIVLLDKDGYYVGDWRISDVDSVGRVQRLLNMSIHSCEKLVIKDFSALMSKDSVSRKEIETWIKSISGRKLGDPSLRFQHFNKEDQQILNSYLSDVLGLKKGITADFGEFFSHMDEVSDSTYTSFNTRICDLLRKEFYDKDGKLIISRQELFQIFHQAYECLGEAIRTGRDFYDRMDIAIAVKQKVLGYKPNYVTTKADIVEIMDTLKGYQHLTVVFPDALQRLIPIGVIHREDLEASESLITVTLRDFCNSEEIKLSQHAEIISAIDHHRSDLRSRKCMTINIADVQSANVLLAEMAFTINDKYSQRGQSLKSIRTQIASVSEKDYRLSQTLYRKLQALHHSKGDFFINPEREIIEYILFLNAIVDDTDLFSKCGWRDLECIVELTNRIKSLICGEEKRVICIDDLPRDRSHLSEGIQRCLDNEDIRSFYEKLFDYRQELINEWLIDPELHGPCFEDRKVQNEICSVSQTKIFEQNHPAFRTSHTSLLNFWLQSNKFQRRKNARVDFFLHMMSTISRQQSKSASEELHDELWLSIPANYELGESRLRQFFYTFRDSHKFSDSVLEITLYTHSEEEGRSLGYIISHSVLNNMEIQLKTHSHEDPMLILKLKAGSMNSRKADITPFLPN